MSDNFVYCPSGKTWLYDEYTSGLGLSFEIESVLANEVTAFQNIKIVKSKAMGNVLILNNWIYRTEDGGSIMPEMIVHVPVNTGVIKKRVLLIGGGDGYSLAELTKYQEIENIDMVDIDEKVITLCKKHFPTTKSGFNDKRVSIYVSEGAKFLKAREVNYYDLILITGTEAYDARGKPGISYSIFEQSFYELCFKKLSKEGILLTDGQNGYYGGDFYKTIATSLNKYFPIVKSFTVTAKFIPGGMYVINIASKKDDPEKNVRNTGIIGLNYYSKQVHKASFTLPKFLE